MSTGLHPDVYERPYYVLENPTMYTRDEVRAARFAAFWNPDRYRDNKENPDGHLQDQRTRNPSLR